MEIKKEKYFIFSNIILYHHKFLNREMSIANYISNYVSPPSLTSSNYNLRDLGIIGKNCSHIEEEMIIGNRLWIVQKERRIKEYQ